MVFPESFVPGYPDWLWRMPVPDDADWYARFQDQAIEIDGPHLDKARAAAEAAGVWVALGITERIPSGTLYNAVVYIDDGGEIAGLHRKLDPDRAERTVWANGQGPMLTVVDIGGVKVGSLICWENYMPLARAALYEKGIDVLLAPTWDNSDEWVPTLRHTAKEGQVFVVGVTACLRDSDVPPIFPVQTTSTAATTTSCPRATRPSSPPAARSSTAPSSARKEPSPPRSISTGSPPAAAPLTQPATTHVPTFSPSPST